MFDCGIHPAYKGLESLPMLDEIDISTVDVALITHFHLDHCAAVPYLLRKTRFKVIPGAASTEAWTCWVVCNHPPPTREAATPPRDRRLRLP